MKKLSMWHYAMLITCTSVPAYAIPECGHGCKNDAGCQNYAYEQNDYRYLHCTNMGLGLVGKFSCCNDPDASADTEKALVARIKKEHNSAIVSQAEQDAKDKAEREAAEKAAEAARNGTLAT